MKQKMQVKYLIPIACILWGGIFAGISLKKYEIFVPSKGPMAGFMPLLIGGLLVFVGFIDLFQAKKHEEPSMEKENWYLVLGVLLAIAGSYVIGVLPGGYILAFCWLRFKEKYPWKTVIGVMLFLLVLVIGVFVIWLKIPFQYGLVGDMLKNMLK